MKWILILVVAVLTFPASAGRIYKCLDANGNNTYQQVPCPKQEDTVNVRRFAPVPDSPTVIAPRRTTTIRATTAAPTQNYYQPAKSSRQSRTSDAERKAMMSDIDSQIRGLGQLNNRSKREMAAELMRMKVELTTGSPGATRQTRQPTGMPPESAYQGPHQIRDQNGNIYVQDDPNSTFVRDQKTGKQCFKNGAFIHCD